MAWENICFKIFETYISYHLLFKDGQRENNIFSFVIPYRCAMTAAKAISVEEKYYFPKKTWFKAGLNTGQQTYMSTALSSSFHVARHSFSQRWFTYTWKL